MPDVRVLATSAIATGFALAGLNTTTAQTPEQGRERALALAANPDVAVMLVEETALEGFSAAERAQLLTRDRPIVVPFASPRIAGPPAGESALILDILRRAVGYRVRLT